MKPKQLLLLVVLFIVHVAPAQDPHYFVYDDENGLPSNEVYSLITADGRYQAIALAAAQDCERAETATRAVAKSDPGGYRRVCGVFVDGRPVRYVCSVLGGDQRRTPTTLRFPDMVMVLHWLDGGRVRIELEGMRPLEGTWSESEGETDIVTPEKTWFFVTNREMAARAVEGMAP